MKGSIIGSINLLFKINFIIIPSETQQEQRYKNFRHLSVELRARRAWGTRGGWWASWRSSRPCSPSPGSPSSSSSSSSPSGCTKSQSLTSQFRWVQTLTRKRHRMHWHRAFVPELNKISNWMETHFVAQLKAVYYYWKFALISSDNTEQRKCQNDDFMCILFKIAIL